jgi:hypothetical protein
MSTLKWIIVRNPNMREEKYLTGVCPIKFDIIERHAMKFSIKQVLAISENLLNMGISHELRQTR